MGMWPPQHWLPRASREGEDVCQHLGSSKVGSAPCPSLLGGKKAVLVVAPHPLVLHECPACMVAGLWALSCPVPAMGFSEAAAHPAHPQDSVLQGKQLAACSVG